MSIDAIAAAVTNSLRNAHIVTSSAVLELPRAGENLYFVSCSSAVYVHVGSAAVADASTTAFTYYFPANFFGLVHMPGEYVKTIRDSADGVIVFTAVRPNNIA